VSSNNEIKLCDFGSATVTVYAPDNSWSANKRSLIEDEIAKQTTPMYRAPEMLDLYSNEPIDVRADIWAMGCVLYLLCFNRHPFEDGAKLRIINGKYVIPAGDVEFKDFHDLIRCMLNTEASKRPEINEVIFHLENIAQTRGLQLVNAPLKFLSRTESLLHSPPPPTSFPMQQQQQPVSNHQQQSQSQNSNNAAGGNNWMFGNAAASLFKGIKTIKDASSKVMDSVQQYEFCFYFFKFSSLLLSNLEFDFYFISC
jgi:cyclin G-associated kinase